MTIHPDVFPDVFAIFKYLQKQGWLGIPFHTPPYFEVMTLYGNRMAASPMPMSPLWRGESKFHEHCMPSLYRRGWTELERLERQIQLEDFKQILQINPEIKEMEEGGLEVNYNGLAQHYGIETNVLDLTNSFLVAAFFATTTYDPLMDVYQPIVQSDLQGVIYFFPTGSYLSFGHEPPIWPIGLAALRRPGEQRGFGMEMTEQNKDLNRYHGVRLFRFFHSEEVSFQIWDQTMGGGIFFPYDPMTEKVRNMRKYRIYSEEAFQMAFKKDAFNLPIEEARNALVHSGCTFIDKLPFAYTKKEIVYINDLYRKMYPGNFEGSE